MIDNREDFLSQARVCYQNEIYGTLAAMADVVTLNPVPRIGDLFIDARGDGRTMRVSVHADRGIVVVSLWATGTCRASFQLPLEDADRLVTLLAPATASPASPTSPGSPEEPADTAEFGHPYPGLADTESIHITGAIVPPNLPQAS